ncbi:STAS domain-containing protein [Methylomonas sp. LL1]|uniref:STAS domain-containing protein n=1 Tax=Methylomonas sp. LL1 TaxID=2785785 RepID=UPI0018C3B9CC|nr:STAS domain-containing protein [Methylomonas sp. LL1]QPK64192.1 STAS domain-containing protein [Methylomonas sp. LL1]
MSENDDNSLIGYDPLAWMHDPDQQKSEAPAWVDEPTAEELVEPDQNASIDNSVDDSTAGTEEVLDVVQEWPTAGSADTIQRIALEPAQNIQNVAQLHEQLLHMLNTGNKIEIDASAVTQIDTATLQLLLILKQTAINLQKEVAIDFPSEKFTEAAGLLGIAGLLEVDQSVAGFF